MLYENEIEIQRALLVAVDTGDYDAESSMDELWELTKSSGTLPIATKIQKRPAVKTATCVGSGMVKELGQLCQDEDIDVMIFDRELSPTQIRNIEHETGVRVVDRTMLILDIFAQRAITKEGKLQVELAQLKYMMPRLSGKGIQLSRLGGGIGTRGPGETKLETDRRHIRRRIDNLRAALKEVEKNRSEITRRREKDGVVSAAIVGYTNAGKSTLMNLLTDAGVLSEDKLFATLDPTARALKLPNGKNIMLIDTVGLIRRLPHHLVESFKSTLEQAAFADIVLNVCDASNPEAMAHLEVTNELLDSFKAKDRPIITVLNKWDLVEDNNLQDEAPRIKDSVKISATKNFGIESLLVAIEEALPEKQKELRLLIPFEKSALAAQIRKDGVIMEEEYVETGLKVHALVDLKMLHLVEEYIVIEN